MYFTRVRPKKNEHRWYAINYGPTLFGAWGVILSWGRIGTNRHQQKVLEFESEKDALDEVRAQVERRLGRGYELASGEICGENCSLSN